MLYYARDKEAVILNKLGAVQSKLNQFKFEDDFGQYKLRGFRRSGNNSLRTQRPALYYPIYVSLKENRAELTYFEGSVEVLPIDPDGTERCWRWGQESFAARKDKYIKVKEVKGKIDLYVTERMDDYSGEKAKTLWNKPEYTGQTATGELKKLFGSKPFSYPKSISLMKDMITVTTNPGDIILDFFAGSGTTGQAVIEHNKEHKGNRKFILCEQMDYAKSITFERVKRAIMEQKTNDNVIYCELADGNANIINEITLSDGNNLIDIYQKISQSPFLNCRIDKKKMLEMTEEFEKMDINGKKQILLDLLDLNTMYLNLDDIDDETYSIPSIVKSFNEKFYGC